MSHTTLRIPQEIFDAVVDRLASSDDSLSLRACALASRVFQHRSQLYLFRSIQLSEEAHISALDCIFESSPHLASHVRDVKITTAGSSPIWSSPPTTRIIALLGNISSITLQFPPRIVYGRRAPDTLGPPALASAHFASLQALVISACIFQTRTAHEALIASLPSLRKLEVGAGVRCWECLHYRGQPRRAGSASDIYPTLPNLETLKFDCAAEAGRCLLEYTKPTRLGSLEIVGGGAVGVEGDLFSDVLECVGSVEEVDVDLRCPPIPEVIAEPSSAMKRARRWVYTPDNALSDRLDSLLDSLPSDVHILRLRLDTRACSGANWVDVGASLAFAGEEKRVEKVIFVMEMDVDPEVGQEVVRAVRRGLGEEDGMRTVVEVE